MKYLKTIQLIKKELKKALIQQTQFGSGVKAQDRLYLILKKNLVLTAPLYLLLTL